MSSETGAHAAAAAPPKPPKPPTPSKQTPKTILSKTHSPSKVLNINVGVLGHVDSGKTSLVKTLSTLLSTAALDKSSQSRARGITLDLGFSCFVLEDLPPQLRGKFHGEEYDRLQVTLVDCPGHASLIRTIIGGAQIIDMVLLVLDATKGIQTQTAECIVIAEMTTRNNNLVICLNKVDLFAPSEREEKLRVVEARVRGALRNTRFVAAPMVGVAAAVGGEKVAALTMAERGNKIPSSNIEGLLELMKGCMTLPDRRASRDNDNDTPFHFSIDHCFAIKGQGTVITGTCLSGHAKVNDIVQFPELGLERKIKTIQMFRRQVTEVNQGDRAGICLANLDSKLIERGIAVKPGSVSLIYSAVALVRKVRFFRGKLPTDSKFHVSVGHTTIMATVHFFGARELSQMTFPTNENDDTVYDEAINDSPTPKGAQQQQQLASSSLGGASASGLPRIPFNYEKEFLYQAEMVEKLKDLKDNSLDEENTSNDHNNGGALLQEGGEQQQPHGDENEKSTNRKVIAEDVQQQHSQKHKQQAQQQQPPLHWAILHFQTPVFCPWNSLIIGSRLDTDVQANTCRLAFSGRLIEKFDPKKDTERLKIYTHKEKTGIVFRLGDPYKRNVDEKIVRYELFGNDLFKKETNMAQFVGMMIETEAKEVGIIQSSFGTSGKFKVRFPAGTEAKEGEALSLRFKRYAHDVKKEMVQHGLMSLPKQTQGVRIELEIKKKSKNSFKKSKGGGGGKSGGVKQQQQSNGNGRNTTVTQASEQTSHQQQQLPPSQTTGDTNSSNNDRNKKAATLGEITALKKSNKSVDTTTFIVSGLFTPEMNIRECINMKVLIVSTNETGVVDGPFGKAGKCKVSFQEGATGATIGSKVHLLHSQ